MIPGISSLTIFSKYSCKLTLNTNFRSFRVLIYKTQKLLLFPSQNCTRLNENLNIFRSFFLYNLSLNPPPIFLKEFAVSCTVCKMPFAEDKEKYLQMNLDEKRTKYHCKENFVTLEKLPSWTKYSEDVKRTNSSDEAAYPVNKAINDKISIFDGDITALEIDAIVNAANKSLRGGGGVDGAIHRAAGSALYEECVTLNGCPTGEAKITGGYKLPAKYVIHTVGPVGEKPDYLRSCYNNSLECMRENNLRSIAFPCISTGVYKYPSKQAAHVALKTVREFLERHEESVDRVIFCLFLDTDVQIYETLTQVYFPL